MECEGFGVKITLNYVGPSSEDGARFAFQHEAEVRDPDEAALVGREFATLTCSLANGMIEGQRVAMQVEDGST